MKKKFRMSEREYQNRLQIMLKSSLNTEVQPLRSLKTVTKKRRALKEKVAKNFGLTTPSTTPSKSNTTPST
jgi:hypothetical protein